MRHVSRRCVATLAAPAFAVVLGWAGPAQALTSRPVWKCRASASYATINGGDRAETIVANGNVNTARGEDPDQALCATGEAGAGNLPAPLGIAPDLLTASSASAVTAIEPAIGSSSEQVVAARGRVDNLALRIPRGGTVVIGALAADATAAGRCAGGSPQLTGSSRVAGLTLAGAPIDADELAAALARMLSSTDVVKVTTDETIRAASVLTVRALHIVVRRATATVVDAVISEAKVGFDGPVCDPAVTAPAVPAATGFGQSTPDICPVGAVFVAERGLCIIPAGQGGSSMGDIIIGRPFEGPSGGSVLQLDVARRRYNSRCLSGPGNKYVLVGSRRSDRLFGTPKRDRILGFGGSDRIDGTSAGDCLDGGRGSDNLLGALGNDRMYGGSGNDRFNGGPGDDEIVGDSGRDTINGGYGADRVSAGGGNDAINVATAGRRATVDCGRGYDRVRLNNVERRRVHGCERPFVLPD